MGGGQADADLEVRHAGLLGGHQGGELGVLSHDYVGPPLPHRGPHGRQHRAHVKRREHLSHDQPLGVVGGQGPDTRPQSPEFIFWRGAPDPEWVTGALHRVGERRRPAPRPVGARGGIIPSRHSLREASRSGPCLVRVAGCGSCLPRLGAPGISVRWCPLSRPVAGPAARCWWCRH
jgi:hypothetical protein